MSRRPKKTEGMKPSQPAVADRFSLACVSGLTMYACAAGYGAFIVYNSSSRPGVYLGVVLGLPAIAAIMFLITAFSVPSLLAPKRLVYPLNVTLPLVFAAYVVLTGMLLTSTGSSLIIPFDKLRVALFWLSPRVLILVTLSQIACLTALTKLKAEPVD